MKLKPLHAFALLSLTGCIQMDRDQNLVPPTAPVATHRATVDYERFAACAYLRLSAGTTFVHVTNLPGAKTSRIYWQNTANNVTTRYWEMDIVEVGSGQASVTIRSGSTLVESGEQRAADLWAKIQSCGA